MGGSTKREVKDKLEALHADLSVGIAAPDGRYTVGQAIQDWLRDGLDGRAEKTVTLNRGALKPFADRIGKRLLRELTARCSTQRSWLFLRFTVCGAGRAAGCVDGYRQRLALWRVGRAAPSQRPVSMVRNRADGVGDGMGRSGPEVADIWRTGSRH